MTIALAEAVRSIKCVVENSKKICESFAFTGLFYFHGQISTLLSAHNLVEVCRGKKHCMSNI